MLIFYGWEVYDQRAMYTHKKHPCTLKKKGQSGDGERAAKQEWRGNTTKDTIMISEFTFF